MKMQLFSDPSFNYAGLTALGMAAYGVTEVGEVLTVINAINAAGASKQSFTDQFLVLADRLAQESADSADRVTKADKALRASAYYAQALFYVLGTTQPAREIDVHRACQRAWQSFLASAPFPVETLMIPVDGAHLPAWLFRPDAANRKRPTVILTNGSDGQPVDPWSWGAAAALERGWNALIYNGPGQGGVLFEQKIPFTAQWEKVVTPIVDRLLGDPSVDPQRIAITGLSMGGNLVPRAAAFEHRLAAVVAEPGVVSPWAAFAADFRELITTDKGATNAMWNNEVVPSLSKPGAEEFKYLLAKRYEPFGADVLDAVRQGQLPSDIWTPSQIIQQLDVAAVLPKIKAPTLIIDYEDEQFYPGQAEQMFNLLTCPKDFVTMTAAEGANFHCSPMAPRRHNEVVFNWLDQTVGGAP